MDDGEVEVESVEPIELGDITDDLARESGFANVADLLGIAKHGSGRNVYLIRFRYLPPGAWLIDSRRAPTRRGTGSGERSSVSPKAGSMRRSRP